MLSIYICEDQRFELNIARQYIEDYLMFHYEKYVPSVFAYTNPHLLLNSLERNVDTNIYFLDIDLHTDIDGIQTAKSIRNFDPRGFIIFITTHSECAPLTFKYQIEALGYIVKGTGDLRTQINKMLDLSFERYKFFKENIIASKVPQLKISDCSGTHNINENEIHCILCSPDQHKLNLYTNKDVASFYGTINKTISSLKSDFFILVNRSSIINANHIKTINYNEKYLIMNNGCRIELSRTGISKLKSYLCINE